MKAAKEKAKDAALLKVAEWMALHARCPPYCASRTRPIVPDGAYVSGLCKDYGGRYAELGKCDCGREEAWTALCHAVDQETRLKRNEAAP